MEGEVTHFLADAEMPVGLEFIFAYCTIIRPSVEQSGVVITVQICTGKVHGSNFGQHTRSPLLFASLTPENSGSLVDCGMTVSFQILSNSLVTN
jgi:hypothetical protein